MRDRRGWLTLAGLCLLAILVYANSLGNGFASDDMVFVRDNPDIRGVEHIPAILGGYAPWGMYRPITFASYALDWEIWGGRPFGFHLTNVLLHAAVSGLVFLLLLGMGGGLTAAAAGAAVFAVHPVHVEAVANVVGRAELLAALFFLAACLVYLRCRPGWRTGAALSLLYFLSLWSKEMGVTLPGAILLLEAHRSGLRRFLPAVAERWRTCLGLGLTLALYFGVRAAVIGRPVGAGEGAWFVAAAPETKFWTAVRLFPEYVRLMFVPLDLSPDYGPAVIVPEHSWTSPLVLIALLTAILCLLLVVRAWSGARLLSVGTLWFAGTILPVSGLVIPNQVLLAERTLYTPSIGLAIFATGLLLAVERNRYAWRRPALAAVALWAVGAAVRTWVQNPVWRDSQSVVQYLVRQHPESHRSQWFLAERAMNAGSGAEALARYRVATRMVPGKVLLRIDFAKALARFGHHRAAAAQYDTALALQPSARLARLQLVSSLLASGQHDRAVAASRELVRRFPGDELAHHLRARALVGVDAWEMAASAREEAARVARADNRWAHWTNLAAIHLAAGDRDAAEAALARAREASPPGRVPPADSLAAWLRSGDTGRVPLW